MYVHVAGHSNYHVRAVTEASHPPFLWSYWAYRKLGQPLRDKILASAKTRPFISDSGVFSMAGLALGGEDDKYKAKLLADMPNWIEEYLGWARENKSWLRVIAEMDLHHLYGVEQVWKWREEYFFPFQEETGIAVLFTWREISHLEEARKLLDDPRCRYYAFGGTSNVQLLKLKPKRRAFALEAYKRGRPVHGYAQVGKDWLNKIPYASVDSTTWSTSDRFGALMGWNHREGIMQVNKNQVRKGAKDNELKSYAGRKGTSLKFYSNEREHKYEAFAQNIRTHTMLQTRYTSLWRRRGVNWSSALKEIYGDVFTPEEVVS